MPEILTSHPHWSSKSSNTGGGGGENKEKKKGSFRTVKRGSPCS